MYNFSENNKITEYELSVIYGGGKWYKSALDFGKGFLDAF